MRKPNDNARQARIGAYKARLAQKLAAKMIDTGKPEFADLVSNRGKPMSPLNGAVIIKRDKRDDGSLRGVVSVDLVDLAAMLPDIKVDPGNETGWKKQTEEWKAEGIDILEGVADPAPDEYLLDVEDELLTLDIGGMSAPQAKEKLLELQQRLAVVR